MKTLITILALIITATAHSNNQINNEFDAVFFDTNSQLYYEIGGAKTYKPLVVGANSNIDLGLDGSVDVGYSCGKFDIKSTFKDTMDDFKNGADDAVNTVIQSANAAISSLPALALKRALPSVYDMFQEYKLDAKSKIDIASQSCEQMEEEILAGGNPHADFVQAARAQIWQDEAENGGNIVRAKKKADGTDGNPPPEQSGVTSYGDKKVGGIGQKPYNPVSDAIIAGYNFNIGNTDPTNNTAQAPTNSELNKQFATVNDAIDWTTDVVGEKGINNTKTTTKSGNGLKPKIIAEQQQIITDFNNGDYAKYGINQTVLNKLDSMTPKQQQTIIANIIDELAIANTIKKALTARRMLLTGQHEPNEQDSTSKLGEKERTRAIKTLEKEIELTIFEYRTNKQLANTTIVKILQQPVLRGTVSSQPNKNPFL